MGNCFKKPEPTAPPPEGEAPAVTETVTVEETVAEVPPPPSLPAQTVPPPPGEAIV